MNAAQNPLEFCPYWVGDILTTMSEIQPAQRWPGTTWEQITDCMLRAADKTHPAGSTGGCVGSGADVRTDAKTQPRFCDLPIWLSSKRRWCRYIHNSDWQKALQRELVWWNRKRIQRRKPAHAHREQVHGCVYVPSNRLTPKGVAV